MDNFFFIRIAFSFLRIYLSTRKSSDDVKFERYKDQGTEYKKQGKLRAAIRFYKRALNHAGDPRQKAEVWRLIVFLQTDRAFAAHSHFFQESGRKLKYTYDNKEHFWFFHGSEPPDYKEPPRDEILK